MYLFIGLTTYRLNTTQPAYNANRAGPPGCPGKASPACHRGLAPPRGLVVELEAVAGEHAVSLAVILGHPIRIDLGSRIRALRLEGVILILRRFGCTKHFRSRHLVEARPGAPLRIASKSRTVPRAAPSFALLISCLNGHALPFDIPNSI